MSGYHKTEKMYAETYDLYVAKIREQIFYQRCEDLYGDKVARALGLDKGSMDKILKMMIERKFLTRHRGQKNEAYRYRRATPGLMRVPFRKTPADLTYTPRWC